MQSYIYTALGVGIIAFGAGWRVHSDRVKAKENDALQEAIQSHNLKVGIIETELRFRQEEIFRLNEQLGTALGNVRTEYRTIEKEVPKYVPQNTDVCNCSLGPEFVSLFNRAATRNQGGSTSTQVTPFDVSDTLLRSTTDLAGGYTSN